MHAIVTKCGRAARQTSPSPSSFTEELTNCETVRFDEDQPYLGAQWRRALRRCAPLGRTGPTDPQAGKKEEE